MATSIDVTLPKIGVTVETAFTVTMLREYVTTTLSDAVLQTYLDAAFADIDDVAPSGPVNELIRQGRGDLLMLAQPAEEILSIVERDVTLAADDYEVRSSGQTLRRLRTGTNPAWGWQGRIDVSYIPDVDAASRIRVAIELVKLDLVSQSGLTSQTIGTWSETYNTAKPYAQSRAEILASIGGGVLIA